jgi:hypothetical protein
MLLLGALSVEASLGDFDNVWPGTTSPPILAVEWLVAFQTGSSQDPERLEMRM